MTQQDKNRIKRELADELDSKLADWGLEAQGVYQGDELDEPEINELLQEVLDEKDLQAYFS